MQQFLVHFIWALKYDHDHRTPLYVQCTIGHYMLNLNFVRINRLQQKCHWSFLRGKIPNLLAKWCNHSLPPKKYINDSIQKIGWKALIRSESFITFDSQKGLLKTLRWRWRVHSLLTQAHHSLALAISPVLCIQGVGTTVIKPFGLVLPLSPPPLCIVFTGLAYTLPFKTIIKI